MCTLVRGEGNVTSKKIQYQAVLLVSTGSVMPVTCMYVMEKKTKQSIKHNCFSNYTGLQ